MNQKEFKLCYSNSYKIGMGFLCGILAVFGCAGLYKNIIDIYADKINWITFIISIFSCLLMLIGSVLAFLWIYTRTISFNNNLFKYSSLFGEITFSLTEIKSYWRHNENVGPTIYIERNRKKFNISIDKRMDPENIFLELIKKNDIVVNRTVHNKNQKALLAIFIMTCSFALYLIYEFITKNRNTKNLLLALYIIFFSVALAYSYLKNKKFDDK